jgi:hypothetical protein
MEGFEGTPSDGKSLHVVYQGENIYSIYMLNKFNLYNNNWCLSLVDKIQTLQIPPYGGNLNEIAVRLTGIEMGTSLEKFHCIIVSICICWYYSVKSIAGKLKKYILSLFFRWYDIFIGLVKY